MGTPPGDISYQLLKERVDELEAAIRDHRDARGDDRCWVDDLALYEALGDGEVPKDEQLALTDRDAFLRRCELYWDHRQKPGCKPWVTVESLEKRIAELAEMLNKTGDEARLQVDSERDACVRKLQFLLETAEETPEFAQGRKFEGYRQALERGIESLKARADPGVQWIDEMAHGSKLGEFIEKMVDERSRPLQGFVQAVEAWLKKPCGEMTSDLADAYRDLPDRWKTPRERP